jgi:hypothetical protein
VKDSHGTAALNLHSECADRAQFEKEPHFRDPGFATTPGYSGATRFFHPSRLALIEYVFDLSMVAVLPRVRF